jgi:hypothetical protein
MFLHAGTKNFRGNSTCGSELWGRSKNLLLPMYFLTCFKLTQPLTVSRVQIMYNVKGKVGKPDRKLYPLPCGLRNPYRNLKSENSQDYAQNFQRNCRFMNSASRGTREYRT